MKAIIMAAGKGTRLNDATHPMPKVLREAAGRPLLDFVINDTIPFIGTDDITIVVGYMAEHVMARFPNHRFATQTPDGYGTGFAVKCGISYGGLDDYQGELCVLSGDVPLIKRSTIEGMIELHRRSGAKCTLLSCKSKKPHPFGRIIRDENGKLVSIKEHKDCTDEERKIDELNAGCYVFDAEALRVALLKLKNNNAQNEYYLTDVPLLMLQVGEHVEAFVTTDDDELLGVNTFEDLATIEEVLKNRTLNTMTK